MADFEFRVTSGPYEGAYALDLVDFTATEAREFRHAVGVPLMKVASEGEGDIDVLAALVWLVKRRGASRGLAFQAVSDAITYANVKSGDEGEDGSLDPTNPPTPSTSSSAESSTPSPSDAT